MKNYLAIGLLCLFITGCDYNYNSGKNKEMDTLYLEGNTVDHIISRLGLPEEQDVIMGKKYYKWEVEKTSYSIWTDSTVYYKCRLIIFVDNEDIIKGYDLDGNQGACKLIVNGLR